MALVYNNSTCWTGIIFLQILHQATSTEGMQAFCYSGSINKVSIAKTTGYMGINIPEFNLSSQHLWCLWEKNTIVIISGEVMTYRSCSTPITTIYSQYMNKYCQAPILFVYRRSVLNNSKGLI